MPDATAVGPGDACAGLLGTWERQRGASGARVELVASKRARPCGEGWPIGLLVALRNMSSRTRGEDGIGMAAQPDSSSDRQIELRKRPRRLKSQAK
jgi:hypothetical protein